MELGLYCGGLVECVKSLWCQGFENKSGGAKRRHTPVILLTDIQTDRLKKKIEKFFKNVGGKNDILQT